MADDALGDKIEETIRRHMAGNGADDAQAGELGEWDAGEDDYSNIPPRGWMLGNVLCRRFLAELLGDGGVGKTALRFVQYLSLATGRSLTGEHVFRRCRVLILLFEDGRDEFRRRLLAAMLRFDIKPAELKGWLFCKTIKGPVIAEMRDGTRTVGALEAMLRRAIERRGIDCVYLDPFVKAHAMEENDNAAIDFAAGILAGLADEFDISVDVAHHKRKGLAAAGDADAGRGAGSLKDAGRLVYTLTVMTPEEASAFGVGEAERRSLIRLDSGKVNLAPPSREARWFKLIGVKLNNTTKDYPNGDEVQTVEPWTPPDTWAGLSHHVLNEILTAIDKGLPDGERYSASPAATKRAAWKVVLEHAPAKTEAQAREIIRTWMKADTLVVERYEDPVRREKVDGLKVNDAKRPS